MCADADYGDVDSTVRGQTVEPGLLINRVAPKYPKAGRKAQIEKTVVVCAAIGKDGKLRNPKGGVGAERVSAIGYRSVSTVGL